MADATCATATDVPDAPSEESVAADSPATDDSGPPVSADAAATSAASSVVAQEGPSSSPTMSQHRKRLSADEGDTRSVSPPTPFQTPLVEQRKQRQDRSLNDVRKMVNAMDGGDEAKLSALCVKHASLIEENRVMKKSIKETEKLYNSVVKERDRKSEDCKRLFQAKTKLETLCRELQQRNKDIKEENLRRLRDHEASRSEMSEKFNGSLSEIQEAMKQGKSRGEKLAVENINLAKKLQALAEQYEAREDHSKQLEKAHGIEIQLYEAKLQTAVLQGQKANEEKVQMELALLTQIKQRDDQLRQALEGEKSLREQMTLYSDKYDQLHKSLSTSNETFVKFKKEMERMNGSLVKCERESRKWKAKFEETARTLIDAHEKNRTLNEQLEQRIRASQKVEQLARTVTEERSRLLKLVKSLDNGEQLLQTLNAPDTKEIATSSVPTEKSSGEVTTEQLQPNDVPAPESKEDMADAAASPADTEESKA